MGAAPPSVRDLGGGAWTLCSQPSHEPLPSQVPEPFGAGSSISLPVGDWVTVARYEEGKGGPPLKNEWLGIGALQRWREGLLTEIGGSRGSHIIRVRGQVCSQSRVGDKDHSRSTRIKARRASWLTTLDRAAH